MQPLDKKTLIFPLSYLSLNKHETESSLEILEKCSGIIAKHFNKRFSLPFSIFLARLNISPNWITFFNLILGVFTGLIASLGNPKSLLEAGLLFQLVSIIDGCDGEVAKLNNKCSKFGAWFDTFGDNFSLLCFIGGVAYGYYKSTQEPWVLYLSFLNFFVLLIMFFIMFRYLITQKNINPSLVNYEKEVVSQAPLLEKGKKFISITKYLVKKDFFTLLFCCLCIFNFPDVILFLFSLGIWSITLTLLIIQYRIYSMNMRESTQEVIG